MVVLGYHGGLSRGSPVLTLGEVMPFICSQEFDFGVRDICIGSDKTGTEFAIFSGFEKREGQERLKLEDGKVFTFLIFNRAETIDHLIAELQACKEKFLKTQEAAKQSEGETTNG